MSVPLPYPVVSQDGAHLDVEAVQGNFDALSNAAAGGERLTDSGVFTAVFAAAFQATPVAVTCMVVRTPKVVVFSPWGALLSNGVAYSCSAVSVVSGGFTATATASGSLTGSQAFSWIAYF